MFDLHPRKVFYARPRKFSLNAGNSMVEILVALAVSLLLLGGVVTVFASSKVSYESAEKSSLAQANGRRALDIMARDIRAAGFSGCVRDPPYSVSTLNTPQELERDFLSTSIQGYEYVNTGMWAPSIHSDHMLKASNTSNILLLRGPRPGFEPLSLSEPMVTGTDDLVIKQGSRRSLSPADIAMAYNCEARAFFSVTSITDTVISHMVDEAPQSQTGNSSDDFGYVFGVGAQIIPVQTVLYFVRPSETSMNGTSLWRRTDTNEPIEIIPGIESMTLRFGIDLDGNTIVDQYSAASAVRDWNEVYTVEIELIVTSVDEATGPAGPTPFRSTFSTIVGLRNRMHAG
jgi:type IV pilus assembly protein PilW